MRRLSTPLKCCHHLLEGAPRQTPEPWQLRASYCSWRNAWLAELVLDLRVLLVQGLGQQRGQSQTA